MSDSDKRDNNDPVFISRIYKSRDREQVLELCNYYDPIYQTSSNDIDKKIHERLKTLEEVSATKAAAYGSLFHDKKYHNTVYCIIDLVYELNWDI